MIKKPCKGCGEPVSSLAEKCMRCGTLTALGQVDQLFGIEVFLIVFLLSLGFRAI